MEIHGEPMLLMWVAFESSHFSGGGLLMGFEFSGRRVVVLGLGDTGLSMARWLKRHGADISVADTRPAPPHADVLRRELGNVVLECGGYREALVQAADLIAISPGVDRRTPVVASAISRGVPVVGDIELFAQEIARHESRYPKKPASKVLAITGTNGKSTVTRMAGDICAAAGLVPVVAGNIGTPVLDALSDIEDGNSFSGVFVLELSSFQLESTVSLNADAATMLNLSEDHLDRYQGLAEYAEVKSRVFAGGGTQVINRDDMRSCAMLLPDRVVHRFGMDAPRGELEWGMMWRGGEAWLARDDLPLLAASELPVAGLQNAANALAAAALCHAIGVSDAAVATALRNFKALPHRVEKIAELEGVTFYDDSKGTNVGATVAALNGSSSPVVLIAGGDGKGQDFGPLREPVIGHVRAVVLIGRDRERIAAALDGCGVTLARADDMQEAVRQAKALSRAGDSVLLSPACASYDMFRNYMHRGEMFSASVRKLVDDLAR